MKEVTRIIELKMTCINKMDDEEADLFLDRKNTGEKMFAEFMKENFDPDDIHVEFHDFVMDKDGE